MKFSEEVVGELAKFLGPYSGDLELSKLYQWPIDRALSKLSESVVSAQWANTIKNSSDSIFKKSINLRDRMKCALQDEELISGDRKYFINWIIKEWGGIGKRRGKSGDGHDENLVEIVDQAEKEHDIHKNLFSFDRIASWSKYLAFKYPNERAIYDARVIYSLNWLLYKARATRYFPSSGTENTLMKAFNYDHLILLSIIGTDNVRAKIKSDIENRKTKSLAINSLKKNVYIREKDAYFCYCNLLNEIAGRIYPIDPHALTKIEMILFAIADKNIILQVVNAFAEQIALRESHRGS